MGVGETLNMIDPLYAASGFGVGVLVGMTGVGGGSLMTPLLILLFGIHPATAVGTDLLYAAATKTAGSLVHGFARSIEWRVVRRLATGSIPATIVTLTALSFVKVQSETARALVTLVLCGALSMTACALIFRNTIVRLCRNRFPALDDRHTAIVTVVVGAILGVLVTFGRKHDDFTRARLHFLQVGKRLLIANEGTGLIDVFGRDDDHGQVLVDEGVRTVLHFAGWVSFGVDVRDFF